MFVRALSSPADTKYLEQINMIKVLCWDYNPICGSWMFWHFSISLEIFRQSVKGIIVYRIVRYQFIREHYTPTLILVFELKPLKTVVVCKLITGFKSVWSIMTPDTWNEQDFQFFFIPLFGIRQITKTCLFPRPTQVVKVHDPEKRDTDKDVESSRETTERVQSVERAHEETENTSGQCNLEGCLDTNERKEVLSLFDTFLPFN